MSIFEPQPLIIVLPPRTVAQIHMLVTILKTKSSYQAIKTTSTQVMVSQPQLVQQIPDIAELPIGLELEVLIITQVVVPINIMATTGLVLLTVATPTARGLSTTVATSTTTTSPTRTSVCAPAFQSTLRSSRSNNQNNQSPPLIKIKRGGENLI